jgi:hypothetical protein
MVVVGGGAELTREVAVGTNERHAAHDGVTQPTTRGTPVSHARLLYYEVPHSA